jgi:hypothetical protein
LTDDLLDFTKLWTNINADTSIRVLSRLHDPDVFVGGERSFIFVFFAVWSIRLLFTGVYRLFFEISLGDISLLGWQ